MKPALVLSGGGARGAYQVGALKAIADLHEKHARNPFSILSGTSAGAINAVSMLFVLMVSPMSCLITCHSLMGGNGDYRLKVRVGLEVDV